MHMQPQRPRSVQAFAGVAWPGQAQRKPLRTCAQLPEVFRGPGRRVCEEYDLDPAEASKQFSQYDSQPIGTGQAAPAPGASRPRQGPGARHVPAHHTCRLFICGHYCYACGPPAHVLALDSHIQVHKGQRRIRPESQPPLEVLRQLLERGAA